MVIPEKPVLLIGERRLEMLETAAISSKIIKFSNERRTLDVGNYLKRHIEIIAAVFGTTPKEVEDKVPLAIVISKYFDCLEYTAKVITQAAELLDKTREGGKKSLKRRRG